MASTIRLKKSHVVKLCEAFLEVVNWKAETLSPDAWHQFESVWLPKFLEQLRDNEFVLNHTRKNPFVWLKDQIYHSRKLSPGIDRKNAVPLCNTRTGIEAIKICDIAARGQLYYNDCIQGNSFPSLFQIEDEK